RPGEAQDPRLRVTLYVLEQLLLVFDIARAERTQRLRAGPAQLGVPLSGRLAFFWAPGFVSRTPETLWLGGRVVQTEVCQNLVVRRGSFHNLVAACERQSYQALTCIFLKHEVLT